jgi:hypothetical protein
MLDGKPGVIEFFYSDLEEYLNPTHPTPFKQIDQWPHPIIMREYLADPKKVKLDEKQKASMEEGLREVSARFHRYFSLEIIQPPAAPLEPH